MPFWLLVAIVALLALIISAILYCVRRFGSDRLQKVNTATEIIAHTITAAAIVMAGFLYVWEKQWSPRFGIDVKTEVRAVPETQPKMALVQVIIAITNQGRTVQSVNYIQVGAVGLRKSLFPDPQTPQEMMGKPFASVLTTLAHKIDAGETDYAYVEVPVECEWQLVRLIVKVPKPPVTGPALKRRPVYERKLLVSLADVCNANEANS